MLLINDYIKLTKKERQEHLDLNDSCQHRNTYSLELRGLLAYYLNTTVPRGHSIVLGHACNNPDCSNPKHLYWAKKSENEMDKHINDPSLGAKIGLAISGDKNANYGKRPWNITNGHKQSWALAAYLYDNYYSKGWDYSKYGQGITYFHKKYNLACGSGKCMLKLFREGWIPTQDPDWIKEFN